MSDSSPGGARWLPLSLLRAIFVSCAIHALMLCFIQAGVQGRGTGRIFHFSATIVAKKARELTASLPQETLRWARAIDRHPAPQSHAPSPPIPEQNSPIPPNTPENSPEANPKFYLDSELETQPEPIGELILDPLNNIPQEVRGRLTLSMLISKSGEVLWTYIERSDFDDRTNQQLIDEFKASRFSPGLIGSSAVNAIIRIEIAR